MGRIRRERKTNPVILIKKDYIGISQHGPIFCVYKTRDCLRVR